MYAFKYLTFLVILISYLSTCIEYGLAKRDSWKESSGRSRTVRAVDKYTKRQMLGLIPSIIDEATEDYKQVVVDCNKKVEKAIEDCKTCAEDATKFEKKPCVYLIINLIEVLNFIYVKPTKEIYKVVTDLSVALPRHLDQLGKDAVKILEDLGGMTVKLGEDLLKQVGSSVTNTAKALQRVGQDLTNLGAEVADNLAKGLNSAGTGVAKHHHFMFIVSPLSCSSLRYYRKRAD